MSDINLSENQPYLISLDTLDLRYMTRNVYRSNDEVQPIWIKNSMDSYYEFQVIPEIETNSIILKSEADSEKIMCHICDTQVPIHFIKEHYESDKHNTFKKITEEALKRIANNINNLVEMKKESVAKNIYYCDACSETVYNKSVHNVSSKHLKSVKFDNAIKSLLYLYLDKNAIDNFNFINNINDLDNHTMMDNDETDHYINNNDNVKTDFKCTDVKRNNDIKSNKSMVSSNDNHIVGPSKDITMLNTLITKDSHDFKSYIVDMAQKYNLNEPRLKLDGDSILVYSAKGEEHRVSIDHFHGFVRNKETITCIICKEIVNGDINIHKKKKEHVINILKPFDNYFIRKIDDDWNHCVICNIRFIWDAKYHATSDVDHKNKLLKIPGLASQPSQAQDFVTNVKTDKKCSTVHCKICNRYIDTHNYNAHINSMKHKQQAIGLERNNDAITAPKGVADTIKVPIVVVGNKDAVTVPIVVAGNKDAITVPKGVPANKDAITVTKGVAINKDDAVMKHQIENVSFVTPDYMKESLHPSQTLCNICSVNVPNNNKNISEHINAGKHESNLSNMLDGNKIIPLVNGYRCDLCNIKIYDLIEHTKTETHINVLNNFCFVCNVKVPGKGKAIHEAGKPHKLKLSLSSSTSEVQNSDKTVNTSEVPLVINNVVNEVAKSYSQIVVGSATLPDVQNIASNNTDNTSEATVVTDNEMWQIERTSNEKELLCRICESIIPHKMEHLKEHFQGKKHISKCTNMLTENSIKEYIFGYKCELCSVGEIQDFISHIKSDVHQSRLKVKNTNVVQYEYCKICEKKVTEIIQHEKEFSHEVTLYSLLKNNHIDNKGSEYYCNLCNIFFFKQTLTIHVKSTIHLSKIEERSRAIQYDFCEVCECNVDINGHEESLSHRVKVNTIQTTNRIKNKYNHYYCEPCKQTIFKFALLLHIQNSKHATNLVNFNNDMKTEHCGICRTDVKEYEHEEGVSHRAKLYDLLKSNKIISKSGNYFCEGCKRNISKPELVPHVQCEEHLNNLH